MQATEAPMRRQAIRTELRQLNRALAEPMRAFGELHRTAMAEGALSTLQKELIAVAISVCEHCSSCITLHVHDAVAAGATDEQVLEAIGVAVLMGGGPASMYAAEARSTLEDFRAEEG